MKTEISSKLTVKQIARFERLSSLPDEAIDTSDIPEVTDWSGAKRGLFYAGPTDRVAVGLDSDLVAWFESESQTGEESDARINRALRAYVAQQPQKAG